jgi:hypothetical protein
LALLVSVSWRTMQLSEGPTKARPSQSPKPAALKGELTVRVWSPDGNGKRGWSVEDPRSLPVLPGELVQLEVRLNQTAYPYLLWLDGQGHLGVLYPRRDGKFGSKPAEELARETLQSPEALDDGLKMKGPGGLETALLLVRREPLPPGLDLAASIGPLPPSPLRNLFEVAVRGGDEGQPIETLKMARNRGIDSETVKIDDSLVNLMARLRTNWQFEVIKAVRFAYRGE